MAYTVVSALRDLAVKQGKAVVTTIHQPSTDCYSLFDNLIVLTEGRVAYSGPAEEALDFLASAGYPM
jgi:ABC-type multidrug transport system ATPase subunit